MSENHSAAHEELKQKKQWLAHDLLGSSLQYGYKKQGA